MSGRGKGGEAARQASAERLRARWEDPEYRARMAAAAAERMRRQNADPAFQAKANAGAARYRRSPEGRAAAAAVFTRYFADPANRERHSEWQRRRMADPAIRAQFAAYALKGSVAAHGIFFCPPELRRLYRKLRQALGREAARAEIRRQLEAATAERLREGGL